jgi:NAD(P)-dependent dehydrogenase (short-subunit alcohol dehydrogenase family)
MSWDVAGRTVLVTGAARGIGAETAKRLHARGANVALVGLEPERLEALAASLGERALAVEADVVDAEAVEHAVRQTVAHFGGIDVAIANAGVHFVGAIADAPIEHVRRVIDVNLYGVLNTVRAVTPHVVERRGYLLNVASLAAASHAPLMGPYAASKAGVEALTDCLRQELRHSRVRVGCAYFGFIDTDLVRGGLEHPSSRTLEPLMPAFVRRPIPVERAAAAIERGVVRRRSRVWAPRFVGGALALRGLMQPAFEARAMRSSRLERAIAQAAPDTVSVASTDPLLGVSADALEPSDVTPPEPSAEDVPTPTAGVR